MAGKPQNVDFLLGGKLVQKGHDGIFLGSDDILYLDSVWVAQIDAVVRKVSRQYET